jgi:seryl-tRNA synthetase
MLDLKDIINNSSLYKEKLKTRGIDESVIDKLINSNKKWKELVTQSETTKAKLNKLSQEVGKLKKEPSSHNNSANLDVLISEINNLKADLENSQTLLQETEKEQNDIIVIIPNIPSNYSPIGKSELENKEIKKWGTPKIFTFNPLDHTTIGEKLGVLDFESAGKITGSRFSVYKGMLSKLERALINFMLDEHSLKGYTEIIPPMIVHERSLYGSGQLPKFKEDLFKIEGRDWYLAPTSEVSLVNLKREEIISQSEFPLKYCAYTPCFRSEAGSYGKDTKGLIRLHQFNKVEMVQIVTADQSEKAFDEMVNSASNILEKLELPFRQIELCTGDMGFSSHRTIDIEVWLPSQNMYREISSVSNCTDFQARRAMIRHKDKEGKVNFTHTLNGSGLAVGRTVVAIMENFQNEDGSINIPKVLWPYMNNIKIIEKNF